MSLSRLAIPKALWRLASKSLSFVFSVYLGVLVPSKRVFRFLSHNDGIRVSIFLGFVYVLFCLFVYFTLYRLVWLVYTIQL